MLTKKIDWANLTPEQIYKKMREGSGSGSPDGWHGQEVKHFPLGVAETFSRMAARWRKARKAPDSVKVARQVIWLRRAKSSKTTPSREEGDMRPISVISVWWRIITSCWV